MQAIVVNYLSHPMDVLLGWELTNRELVSQGWDFRHHAFGLNAGTATTL